MKPVTMKKPGLDFTKPIKTRRGLKVRIYATDGGHGYPVHGAIWDEVDGWRSTTWTLKGRYLSANLPSQADLVQAVPQVRR